MCHNIFSILVFIFIHSCFFFQIAKAFYFSLPIENLSLAPLHCIKFIAFRFIEIYIEYGLGSYWKLNSFWAAVSRQSWVKWFSLGVLTEPRPEVINGSRKNDKRSNRATHLPLPTLLCVAVNKIKKYMTINAFMCFSLWLALTCQARRHLNWPEAKFGLCGFFCCLRWLVDMLWKCMSHRTF